ncbi:MAG: preprotein translocase subunit SecG [Chloroflexi bacterium]|nr:preprotein translocase subunit SecG [Chloroflexota bacterium]
METYINIAQIVLAVTLIASILLQSKGAGLGGLTGGEAGGVYRARRGVEKTLFYVTIGLSLVFFAVAIVNVIITG